MELGQNALVKVKHHVVKLEGPLNEKVLWQTAKPHRFVKNQVDIFERCDNESSM